MLNKEQLHKQKGMLSTPYQEIDTGHLGWGKAAASRVHADDDAELQEAIRLSLSGVDVDDTNSEDSDDLALAIELSLLDMEPGSPRLKKQLRAQQDLASFQLEFFAECKEKSEIYVKQSHNSNTLAFVVFNSFPEFFITYATIDSFIAVMARTCKQLYKRFCSLSPETFKFIKVDNLITIALLYGCSYPTPPSKSRTEIRANMQTLYLTLKNVPVPETRANDYDLNQIEGRSFPFYPTTAYGNSTPTTKEEIARNTPVFPRRPAWTFRDMDPFWMPQILSKWVRASLPPRLTSVTLDASSQQMVAYLMGTLVFTGVNLRINYIITDINSITMGCMSDAYKYTNRKIIELREARKQIVPSENTPFAVHFINRMFMKGYGPGWDTTGVKCKIE